MELWRCGITRARVPHTWRLRCVFGAERGTEGKGYKEPPIVCGLLLFWGHVKGNYLGYWEPQQILLVLFKARKMLQQTPTYLKHHSA